MLQGTEGWLGMYSQGTLERWSPMLSTISSSSRKGCKRRSLDQDPSATSWHLRVRAPSPELDALAGKPAKVVCFCGLIWRFGVMSLKL